ncbi:putative plasmepsin V [Cryptosporidium felis]|nr:putative plasmepsin V [Cryptosporidium felis]
MNFFLFLLLLISDSRALVLPLYGSIYNDGYYYIKVNIGGPIKQWQLLIVDTGSALTGFTCKGCKSCGMHKEKPFNINLSNTSSIIKCEYNNNKKFVLNYDFPFDCNCNTEDRCVYNVNYTEGSNLSGYFFEDFMEFENYKIPQINNQLKNKDKFILGCHTIEDKLFKNQKATGVFGLANFKNIGINQIINYIEKNNISNNSQKKVLSIRFETNGGSLLLGSAYYDQKDKNNSTRFEIPMCTNEERYCSYIFGFGVENTTLTHNSVNDLFKALFDTGTTVSILPDKFFVKLLREINRKIFEYYPDISGYDERDGMNCWKISNKLSIAIFPIIKIQFLSGYSPTGFTTIEWYPYSYLYLHKLIGNDKIFCLGIISDNLVEDYGIRNSDSISEDFSRAKEVVLGATFFIHKEITFILDENKVIIADIYLNKYTN